MKEYMTLNGKITNNLYNYQVFENFEIFKGPNGNYGNIGSPGPVGEQGLQGIRGYQGDIGEIGDQGPHGFKGKEGPEGNKGTKGVKGDRGVVGLMGVRGERGLFGQQGPIGYSGPVGIEGPKGRTGFQGDQGDQGDMGDTQVPNVDITDAIGSNLVAFRMNGFKNLPNIDKLRNNAVSPVFKDPRNEGSIIPVLQTNYKFPIEAQCPYNGYMNGLVFEIPDLVESSSKESRYEDYSDRITNSTHFMAWTNPGLPYTYRIDCKVIDNN